MLFAAALTLLVVALALGLSAWARVRESDRYIDELADGLAPTGVADELTRMFQAWRDPAVSTPFDDEGLARRVEQWRRGIVSTPYDPDRG